MTTGSSFIGNLTTLTGRFCVLVTLVSMSFRSPLYAEGLPYGGNVEAMVVDGDLIIDGDSDHNNIFVSTDPNSIASFRDYFGINTPSQPNEVVIHGGFQVSEDGQISLPGEYSQINQQLLPVILNGFTGDIKLNTGDGADDVLFLGVNCEKVDAQFGDSPAEGTSRFFVDTCITNGRMEVKKQGFGNHFSRIMSTIIHGKLKVDGGNLVPGNEQLSGCWLIGSEVYGNLDLNTEGKYIVFQSSIIDGNLIANSGLEDCIAHLGGCEVAGNVCFSFGDGNDNVDISYSKVMGHIKIDGGAGYDEYGIDNTKNYDVFSGTTYKRLIVRKFENLIIAE